MSTGRQDDKALPAACAQLRQAGQTTRRQPTEISERSKGD
jgi:hypothetical protein